MTAAMLAAVHTAITGWDVLAALVVVVVALVVDRPRVPPITRLLVLFGVALLVFALLVTW